MNMLRFAGFLWVALLLPSPGKPQEIDQAVELEPLVVTAEGTEENIARPTSILTGKELLTKNKRNIGETVAEELGVTSSSFGPAVGRPIIRGLGGNRVRVLEDGIGTFDLSALSPDHAVAIESLFADQIKIFRGPSALLYGSGVSGGVVNIIDNRILDYVPESIEGDLYGHYNSVANGATGGFRFNAGAGNFAFHVDGLVRDTGDYGIPGFAQVTPEPGAKKGTLENSDIHTRNFAGGLSIIGEPGFLGFSVSHFTNEYGVPDEERVRIDQEQTRFDIKGALYEPLPGIRTIKTRWGYGDYGHKEIEPSGEASTILDKGAWEGRVEFLHQLLGAWDGVLGLQFRNQDLSAAGEEAFLPSSQLNSISLFALEGRDWDRWHFEIGGRFEHQKAQRERDELDTRYNLFNISAGASRQFLEGYSARINFTHSQRAPALEALFSEGPHLATHTFEVGDSSLNKEASYNFDLSLHKTEGDWNWTLNLFANLIDNYIFFQETDQNGDGIADRVSLEGNPVMDPDALLLVSYVQADARFLGAEFETIFNLFDNAHGDLDLRLWTDYVRGELANGANLPRITPLRFGSELNYGRGPWYAGADVMRVHAQNNVAPLETETEGYTMLDIHMGYRLALGSVQSTVFIRATNLLNEEARRHTSFLKNQAPLPGRSALVGIKATF